ncbi:(4Fe-4S)-binding protein [Pseudonocardia sp. TRM90224]|uniref:(4Fe-4S)-binding protein n=1 Tax=Pseudonocardia sp. TRM90224 TaxID=2812678 RepID=UPI0027DF43B7|nr:(4Fe-4S)-binding protein [Pseudonocardia sp. TRM90224]
MSKLAVNKDFCIGAGLCVLTDADVFDQDDDGIVTLLVDDPGDGPSIKEAVANCPSGALSLVDE